MGSLFTLRVQMNGEISQGQNYFYILIMAKVTVIIMNHFCPDFMWK